MKKSELISLIETIVRKQLRESNTVTIADMVDELSTWIKFSPEDKIKAKKSKIDTKSNKQFAKLVKDWQNGRYDEDPDAIGNEILELL